MLLLRRAPGVDVLDLPLTNVEFVVELDLTVYRKGLILALASREGRPLRMIVVSERRSRGGGGIREKLRLVNKE